MTDLKELLDSTEDTWQVEVAEETRKYPEEILIKSEFNITSEDVGEKLEGEDARWGLFNVNCGRIL